jgi:hypothetical protein
MTAIKRLQPVSIYMSPLILRECIACKYSAQVPLLKITSLRQIQIAQRSAQTPTCIHAFVFLSMSFNQLPNKFFIFIGGGILKVK